MRYFADPVYESKPQPGAPQTPSDTQLRSFAAEYFARTLLDLQLPEKERLERVRVQEQILWQHLAQPLWELIWRQVPTFEELDFYEAFHNSFGKEFVREFASRFSREASSESHKEKSSAAR